MATKHMLSSIKVRSRLSGVYHETGTVVVVAVAGTESYSYWSTNSDLGAEYYESFNLLNAVYCIPARSKTCTLRAEPDVILEKRASEFHRNISL